MAESEALLARLRFAVDQITLQKTSEALEKYEKGMDKIGKASADATARLSKMRESAEKLQQIGAQLGVAGAAMLAPFLLAVRTYTNQVGTSEETSRRWTRANEKLSEAQIRVGRETTKVLTPLLEKGADLAEKYAEFIEKNPDMLKAILAVGGGLAAAGTVISLIAQAQKLIATVQLLTGAGAAAGGAALGATLSTLAATLAPLAVAIGGLIALVKSDFGKQGLSAGGQLATVAAYGIGSLFGPEVAAKWGKAIGELTGAIEKADDATEKAKSGFEEFSESQLKAYLDFVNADREATAAWQKQRTDVINSSRLAEQREAEDFTRSRTQAIRDFYQAEYQAQAAYYSNRMQLIRDSSREAQRAEEDHQREMRKLAQDHDDRMKDLAANRDALGMVREMRQAERERKAAESAYLTQVRRKNEDLATTLADNEAEFAAQRAQRFADFAQRLADEDEQRAIAAQRRREDLARQLRDMDAQYQQERVKRRQAVITQLRDLSEALSAERNLKYQYNQAMLADLRRLYAQAVVTGVAGYPSRASGGYVNAGLYQMHDDEFVLNKQTTKAVESLAGGSLDQNRVLSLLAGAGRAGRGSIQYIDQRRIDSRLSSEDRRQITQDTFQLLGELVYGAL